MAVAKVCNIPKCPEPSCVRITDVKEGKYRRDLCFSHGKTTLKHYGDDVDIVEVWNGKTMEDFEDDSDV